MNKCIAFVDDDERFLDLSREHLTYRGYEFIGWRDSRTAFDAIMRQKDRIDGICVDLELCGSPEQGAELIGLLRMNGIAALIFERIVETIFLTVFSVLSVVLLAAVRKIVKLQLNSRLRSANSFATILSNALDK